MNLKIFDTIIAHIKSSPACYVESNYLDRDMDIATPTLTIVYGKQTLSPLEKLESCIFLHNYGIEVRVYFTELGQKWVQEHRENRSELLEVLNFINSNYFPMGSITPRLYLTKTEDITYTAFFSYEMFDDDIVPETLEFITEYMPNFINSFSPFIFKTVLGSYNAEKAIAAMRSRFR